MKGKKAIIFVLALLSSSVPVAFSTNDTLSVDYAFESVITESDQFLIKDTQIQEIPGEPLIPYRAARILLPQNAVLKDVKVKFDTPVIQEGFDLPWGQHPCTFSGPKPEKVGPNPTVYNSNNWYPEKLVEVLGVSSFRGFQILNLKLYPMQYQPKAGTVKFYETLTITVQFGKGPKNKLYRGLADDKVAAVDIVDNPEVAETYEGGETPLATEEYIIITSSSLTSTFQTLATWKAGYNNGAAVYDTTYIYNNYSGTDNQEKIRNFIFDKYTNNGTKYVLLGGDTGVVPYRGFYVSSGGYTDSDMAADMYYGHLDGNWNNDGDSRYGEPGEEDWYAEVAVGRAPVDNSTQAQAFVNKVIAYEPMYKPDVGARKRVCFHQSRVQSGNSPDSRCLAYNCDDWIPGGYDIDYLFEEDQTISKTVWRNAWNAEPIVVVHIGHGNTDVYHINYEPTVSWYGSDVSSHANAFYPWTTSVACISGQFTSSDCLAENYVKDDCGAIGAIYNDNYGWFSTLNACQYSGEFCEMEIRACWSDGYEKLAELRDRSRYYMASSASSNSTYRWCFYERNLMGDPETPCLTTRGEEQDTVTITAPTPGATVSGIVNITTSTTGDIDEVRFYIDGVHKHTDTTDPYTYSWDTEQYSDGSHTIRIDGYVSGSFADDDSITVTVEQQPSSEYIIITSAALQSTFQQLADWKANFVDGTGVYTVSWITSNYSGTDNQEKIRNFIFDKYTNNGTKYVLLGGDTGVVPYRGFYAGTEEYTDADIAADMYYGHLEGSWNNDGDSRYGEPGEEDWSAEVAVGRAPVETVSEAQDFVDKVILYEQADKPKRVVLHQAALNSGNIPDSRCLAWNCDDWVPADWEIIYLFEPSEEEWINAWAKNPLIFQHMGNGGTDWIEISYGVKWYNEDVSKLTNAFWPVFMSPSPCGDFKADDCFAEVLVKDDCGAIAAIAPAGDKFWFSSSNACQYSGKFVEMMFKALFEDGKEHLGDMLNQGKTYMISSVQANSKYRWCYYAFNLIGDPETPVLTKRSSISITNPPDGSRVTGTISITASTLECIDKVKFYIIGVSGDEVNGMLLCEDTIPPFECSWNTPGWSGWCTIRADGYCSGEVRDVDEITVLVENCKVTITYPSEGETVSGTVTCTVNGNCDSVKWYIDGAFKYEDTTAPFQYIWDTTQEPNGGHTIKAEGYISGILMDQGVITCIVDNTGEGLGTTLLSVLILFGFAVIVTKRR